MAALASRGPPVFGAARRVVVTGIGLVTPLGVGAELAWQRLLEGKSGVARLQGDAFSALPARIAGLVPDFDGSRWLDGRSVGALPANIQYGIGAAELALADAGWPKNSEGEGPPRDRTGVAIGCGISGAGELLRGHDLLTAGKYRRVTPYLVPHSLVNMTAGMVAIRRGFRGPNHAVSTACATGAHAIGDAFRFVSLGDADVMVAGGADACLEPIVIAGFCRANALATDWNDDPEKASRPFDPARSGFVIAEGAGVLVLEEREHALARGARIYCEIRGYGLGCDAHHITNPDPNGDGALAVMRSALRQAGVTPREVDYINAHATSTQAGDTAEALAVQRLVEGGSQAREGGVMLSSTKGATGHLLGAAGAVEAAFTALAIHHGTVPHTLNTADPQRNPGVDFVLDSPRSGAPVRAALSNSFGFGGVNASLCFTAV